MSSSLNSLTIAGETISWHSAHADLLSSLRVDLTGRCHRMGPPLDDFASLAESDISMVANMRIRCPIIRPAASQGSEIFERVCILLHGLNERSWDKYLEWAHAVAEKARCAVILFPLAFHVDRSPPEWANFKIMRGVSRDRISRYPGLRQSSMANAAISERLDEAPSRFFLSGLISARDLMDLVADIRSSRVDGLSCIATIGFLGYSIGAYLLQCLTLARGEFASVGRRLLFCGGPYLSAMTPVSKYIMDSRSHERVLDFWVENLEAERRHNPRLDALLESDEGRGFCAMVDSRHPQVNMQSAFSDGATRVIALAGDEVMPKNAILSFFENTGVTPTFLDLPGTSTHIAPFNPLGGDAVREAFNSVFDEAVDHLFG
jgi:hypothetical protein